MMQLSSLILSILVLFIFRELKVRGTNIYVTPFMTCTNSCQGDLTQPYDNIIFALQAAVTQDSPVIILLGSETEDHYALVREADPLSQPEDPYEQPDLLYDLHPPSESGDPNKTLVVFNFTTLEIKPLFCDEAVGLTLPPNTNCIDRDQTITVYLKTIKFTVTVQKELTVQNIVFDGIDAFYDYLNYDDLGLPQEFCGLSRKKCCSSDNEEEDWQCYPQSFSAEMDGNPVCSEYNSQYCDLESNSFFVMENSLAQYKAIQQNAKFINTHLQSFWGLGLISFVEIRSNSNFTLTMSNCTIDDAFFERGLVYISDNIRKNSSITFEDMTFSNYNKWDRYKTSFWQFHNNRRSELSFDEFYEGYLLITKFTYYGKINILNSDFMNMSSVSRRYCEYLDGPDFDYYEPWGQYSFGTYVLKSGENTQTNLPYLMSSTVDNNFVSSLLYIPSMIGSVYIADSTFKNISGISGSVIRIDNLFQEGVPIDREWLSKSSFTLKNSVFDSNFALSRFANILVTSKYKTAGCPNITILSSRFLSTRGCPGSYGNVGLFCQFNQNPYWIQDIDDRNYAPNFESTEQEMNAGEDYDEEDEDIDEDMFFDRPHIIVRESIFQNNLLALSNSLAINGSYYTLLDRNLFQDNGAPSGEELIKYSLSLSKVRWDSFYSNEYFGQSTAVYINGFFTLKTYGNTFKGNWSPFEGSRALGVSLTLLGWTSWEGMPLEMEDDMFVDHTGVPQVIDSALREKLNCYTPPLITLAKIGGDSYIDRHTPEIRLKGLKFENNLAKYGSIANRCDYLSSKFKIPSLLVKQIQDSQRFRSGFLKFLTPSEAADKAVDIENTLDSVSGARSELGLYFSQGEIRNNTVEGGCMFSTLRLRLYLLEDLQIESNQINPSLESKKDTVVKKQSNVDKILASRAGIFCGYQRDAVYETRNLLINANKMKVRNNIGPIFSLFPDELNYLFLVNSLFINNTCEYTSTINAFQGSNISASNNIFINNTNAFGTVFTSSSSNFYSSSFTTYLQNNGRHASLIYGDNKATISQISARVESNTVTPNAYLFDDNIMPQGALYFLSTSVFTIQNSKFTQNNAYSGFIASTGSSISFDQVEFSNHSIVGASLVGNFLYSSNLTITNANMTNNAIVNNPVSKLKPSLITVLASKIKSSNVRIAEGLAPNKGTILLAKMAEADLAGITLSNYLTDNEKGLFSLSFSEISITNFKAENITSLFSLYESNFSLSLSSIQKLKPSLNSVYLINTDASNLTVSKLKYIGGLDEGEYLSLITGSSNRAIINEAQFRDAMYGNNNKIFELRKSPLFFITNSVFEYTNSTSQPIIFALESSQTVAIEKCTFSQTAQLVQDQNTKSNFYFTDNTIITDSNAQKMSLTENNMMHMLNNHFLKPIDNIGKSFPTTQVQIVDSSGIAKLKNNIFFSLYGSKGVVSVQSTKIPYNVESSENSFINNAGSYGGALHLDASVSSTSTSLPSASINSSIFLLNKANRIETDIGNGGAIYQTTSTLIKQITNITGTVFVKNAAEMVGGALFFDYMPPTVDTASKFEKNSANLRPNHIGSYPVRLGYYEEEPNSTPPAMPWDSPSRFLSSSGIHKWNNMPSGLTSNRSYTFVLLDMFGQIFDSDNTSTLEVYPTGLTQEKRYLFSNKLSLVATNGTYVYDSFKLTHKTYETINVTFKSTAIQENRNPPLQSPLAPLDSLLIEVHFRGCGRGEYVLKESGTISCVECQPGFWQTSPVPDALSCQACDSASTFCLGADNVGPLENYWRLNETGNIVRECPISDSCLGSDPDNEHRDPKGACAKGYRGNLCSNCMPGWAKIGKGACTNCDTDVWYYLRVVIVLLVQLVLVVKAVHGTLLISREFNENQKLNLGGVILIRVLTNYFQLISLVAGIPVTWPGVIKSISATSSQAASVTQNVFTLDCMFKSDHVYGVKVVFIKLLLTILGPFALILVGVFCTAIYFLIKKMPILRNRAFKNQVVALTVIICFMMQPSAIQSAFSIFKCENLYRSDSPAYYMLEDYDVQCWEGSHFYWAFGFGVPMLVIWAAVLPFLVFNALRRNKDKLETPEVAQKYSFLYGGYSYDKYYWELVIMFRKFILISMTIGASFHSLNLEVYVAVLMILFWYLLHLFAHPYAEAKLNRLEQYALISAGIINFCGLYFKFVQSTLWLDIIIIICGLGGNLLFFVYFVMLYFALQIEKIKQNKAVLEILAKVGQKCKWINPQRIERLLTKTSTLINRLTTKQLPDQQPEIEIPTKEGGNHDKEVKEVAEDQSPGVNNRLLEESFRDDNLKKETEEDEDIFHRSISLKQVKIESQNEHDQNEKELLNKSLGSERNEGSEIITLDQLLARKTEH